MDDALSRRQNFPGSGRITFPAARGEKEREGQQGFVCPRGDLHRYGLCRLRAMRTAGAGPVAQRDPE